MKHVRRIFVICLAVVMMCTSHVWAAHPFPSEVYPGKYVVYYEGHGGGTYTYIEVRGTVETGIYGTPYKRLAYPITARFFDGINKEIFYESGHYDYWYDKVYKSYSEEEQFQYLSDCWFDKYNIGDPEIWPEEYLDRYEEFLSGHQTVTTSSDVLKYRVDSYEWEGRNITVSCVADYNIMGYNVKSKYNEWNECTYYTITANGGFTVGACIAVTNKSDGKLVYLVKHDSFNLQPDYLCKPGTYSVFPSALSQSNTQHSGTATQTLTATLPEFIDTEKHDITLYFYDPNADTEISSLRFMNPYNISPVDTESPDKPQIPGDASGDGAVNAIDITTLSLYLCGADVKVHSDGDYNGDGLISASDLLLLRRKIAGADV